MKRREALGAIGALAAAAPAVRAQPRPLRVAWVYAVANSPAV